MSVPPCGSGGSVFITPGLGNPETHRYRMVVLTSWDRILSAGKTHPPTAWWFVFLQELKNPPTETPKKV